MLSGYAFPPVYAAYLALSLSIAQPASAPAAKEAQPGPQTEVIVRAPPPTPKMIQEQTSRFVESYAAAPNPNIDQIGRWYDPVCVRVLGMPAADQASKIKARIESVAQSVGLPGAPSGCRANVEIVFTDQPQGAMDFVAKRREAIMGYHHALTRQLKTVTHPIQAWYVTSTRSDGIDNAVLTFSGISASSQQADGEVIDDPQNMAPTGCIGRLSSCYTSEFTNVFIVADSKALDGRPLGAIADDMVMLALSQPRSLDRCNALSSVIDQFAKSPCPGRDPPDGLTAADAAYLTALYSADLGSNKTFEQADIARRMAKILIGASASAEIGARSADSRP